MQSFSTVFGSRPFGIFTQPATPFLLFFQYVRYYNHYDHRKMHFQKNKVSYHNIINTAKMLFLTFNFKRQLNITNIFNATVDFATV